MKEEDYIASGILEAYALRQLSDEERVEVERMLVQYPFLRKELELIEKGLEDLAFLNSKPTSSTLRPVILDMATYPKDEVKVVKMETNYSKLLVAASILIAIGSLTFAYISWNNWQESEKKLAEVLAENQVFASNYNQVNQRLDEVQQAIEIANNPNFKRIVLRGTDNSPDAKATVYWNPSSSEVFLAIQSLKEISEDRQYQLWAIIDGEPVDAGVFDVGEQFLLAMNGFSDDVMAFAVTIEPRGGSENPSLETMLVVGNV